MGKCGISKGGEGRNICYMTRCGDCSLGIFLIDLVHIIANRKRQKRKITGEKG